LVFNMRFIAMFITAVCVLFLFVSYMSMGLRLAALRATGAPL